MRVYKNPEKVKRDKRKERRKEEKVKRNSPDPIVYTTPEGEKIKYIPCDVDHEMVVEKKINLRGRNKNHKKYTHRKGKYRKLL
jgi:hypothetical protein